MAGRLVSGSLHCSFVLLLIIPISLQQCARASEKQCVDVVAKLNTPGINATQRCMYTGMKIECYKVGIPSAACQSYIDTEENSYHDTCNLTSFDVLTCWSSALKTCKPLLESMQAYLGSGDTINYCKTSRTFKSCVETDMAANCTNSMVRLYDVIGGMLFTREPLCGDDTTTGGPNNRSTILETSLTLLMFLLKLQLAVSHR